MRHERLLNCTRRAALGAVLGLGADPGSAECPRRRLRRRHSEGGDMGRLMEEELRRQGSAEVRSVGRHDRVRHRQSAGEPREADRRARPGAVRRDGNPRCPGRRLQGRGIPAEARPRQDPQHRRSGGFSVQQPVGRHLDHAGGHLLQHREVRGARHSGSRHVCGSGASGARRPGDDSRHHIRRRARELRRTGARCGRRRDQRAARSGPHQQAQDPQVLVARRPDCDRVPERRHLRVDLPRRMVPAGGHGRSPGGHRAAVHQRRAPPACTSTAGWGS